MHPTLLEKLRLGAPSSGHIQLSTINRSQSQHAVVEEFYRLQDSSPFPKLPPYFIHSTNDKLSVNEPSEREDIHNDSSHTNGTIHRSRPELRANTKQQSMRALLSHTHHPPPSTPPPSPLTYTQHKEGRSSCGIQNLTIHTAMYVSIGYLPHTSVMYACKTHEL